MLMLYSSANGRFDLAQQRSKRTLAIHLCFNQENIVGRQMSIIGFAVSWYAHDRMFFVCIGVEQPVDSSQYDQIDGHV
ncbi:hypothetical protein D3C74_274750 [compost metagenome]